MVSPPMLFQLSALASLLALAFAEDDSGFVIEDGETYVTMDPKMYSLVATQMGLAAGGQLLEEVTSVYGLIYDQFSGKIPFATIESLTGDPAGQLEFVEDLTKTKKNSESVKTTEALADTKETTTKETTASLKSDEKEKSTALGSSSGLGSQTYGVSLGLVAIAGVLLL